MLIFCRAIAAIGFVVSAISHGYVHRGNAIGSWWALALFIAMFPPFVVGVMTHPAREYDPTDGTHGVSFARVLAETPIWVHLLTFASIAYGIFLWTRVPGSALEVMRARTHDEMMLVTWLPAVFHVGAFGLLVARRA